MVVVPLSKPVNSGVNRAADQSESPSWTGYAAGAALVAGGLLLMSGRRRAGVVAASAGTALALLDQKQALLTIWSALPGFIDQALAAQAAKPPLLATPGPFPVDRQKALGLKMMEMLGFDFNHGRLDVSHHPFCGGTPADTRITTRYDEGDFVSAMMARFPRECWRQPGL